uniref:Uncharacterized protein n=1 Tax=Arundo donax TaxID=35708 RepID=A0A0A9EF07_ARUDO
MNESRLVRTYTKFIYLLMYDSIKRVILAVCELIIPEIIIARQNKRKR